METSPFLLGAPSASWGAGFLRFLRSFLFPRELGSCPWKRLVGCDGADTARAPATSMPAWRRVAPSGDLVSIGVEQPKHL